MTVRSKAYWNAKLVTGYKITQDDWIDIVDTFLIYRPTNPNIVLGSPNELLIDLGNASEAIVEPRTSSGTRAISVDFDMLFVNYADTDVFSVRLQLTGTRAIKMPNGTGGQPNVRVSNEGVGSWDSGAKIYTIPATTGDIVELILEKDLSGDFFDMVGGQFVE
jgi:hypothetical protein